MSVESRSEKTAAVAGLRELVLPVLHRHGVLRAGIFGSHARGEATLESDVDILVELDGQASLFDFIGIKLDLEDVIGRRVDLVEYAAIKPLLRERILSEEIRIL